MSEFEPIKHYQYPDESQSLRIKEMTEISAGAGLPRPEQIAANADILGSADPSVSRESFKFAPTINNKGLRYALWTLNTYTLRLREDGSLADESYRGDWEVSDRDRRLARVSVGKWRSRNTQPIHVDANNPIAAYISSIKNVDLLDAQEEVELAKDIEAGLYAVQKLEGGKANQDKKLTVNQRKQFAEMARIGKDSYDRMFEANLGLVVSIAKKYSRTDVPFEDLIQEGNFGLKHAIEKFDYTLGIKFSTYATRWIEQAMQGALASHSRTIVISRHERANLAKILSVKEAALKDDNIELSVTELAQKSGIEEEKVAALLNNYHRYPLWLDAPASETGNETFADLIYDEDEIDIEDAVMYQENDQEITAAFKNAYDALKDTKRPREKVPMFRVIEIRFGLMDSQPKTHEQVGKILGLGRTAVRDCEEAALKFLRSNEELRTAYMSK